MSDTQVEIVDESRIPYPKDPGLWIIRYVANGEWATYVPERSKTLADVEGVYENYFRYVGRAVRLIRIHPEGETPITTPAFTAIAEKNARIRELEAENERRRADRVPPPGHIIDDTGTVRKVLGTLPITADGCVVGWGAFKAWRIAGNRREVVGPFHEEMGPNGWASQSGGPEKCYSTEQAAREAGGKA